MNKNDKNFMVQKIRSEYAEKEFTELDALRDLDKKVKLPANVFGYTFGSIGAIIAGAGMSLTMTDIGATVGIENPMLWGIIIGIIGFGMAGITYPIYQKILLARRAAFRDEIFALSDKIEK
jgi:hypothetical protein